MIMAILEYPMNTEVVSSKGKTLNLNGNHVSEAQIIGNIIIIDGESL